MLQTPISHLPQIHHPSPLLSSTPTPTPLSLIQNLSDHDSRRRKQSGMFSPWDDMLHSSIIRTKLIHSQDKISPASKNTSLQRQLKLNKQHLLKLSIQRRSYSKQKEIGNNSWRQPIPYRSIDLDLPSFESGKTIDRNYNIKLRRIYNPSKKEMRDVSVEFRSIESDRLRNGNSKGDRSQKGEELRRKVMRRRNNRPIEDLVTREYIFPKDDVMERDKEVSVINYPMQPERKEMMNVNVGSLSKMMVTNNSFFIKHKLKGVYNFGETMMEIRTKEKEKEKQKEKEDIMEMSEIKKVVLGSQL